MRTSILLSFLGNEQDEYLRNKNTSGYLDEIMFKTRSYSEQFR